MIRHWRKRIHINKIKIHKRKQNFVVPPILILSLNNRQKTRSMRLPTPSKEEIKKKIHKRKKKNCSSTNSYSFAQQQKKDKIDEIDYSFKGRDQQKLKFFHEFFIITFTVFLMHEIHKYLKRQIFQAFTSFFNRQCKFRDPYPFLDDISVCQFLLMKAGFAVLNLPKSGFSLKPM